MKTDLPTTKDTIISTTDVLKEGSLELIVKEKIVVGEY